MFVCGDSQASVPEGGHCARRKGKEEGQGGGKCPITFLFHIQGATG